MQLVGEPGGVRRGADWRGAGLIGGYLAALGPKRMNGKGGEMRHGGRNKGDAARDALACLTRDLDLMVKHGGQSRS